MAQREEADLIVKALFDVFGTEDKDMHYGATPVYAQDAILEMKDKDWYWKENEWPGWFMKMKFQELPVAKHGDPFRSVNNVKQRFLQGEYLWDHRFNTYNSRTAGKVAFMSYKNLQNILEKYDGLGLLISNCYVAHDISGDVFAFHEDLKGGSSVRTEEIRADPNRYAWRRKSLFFIITMHSYYFTFEDFESGTGEDWLGKHFQGFARQPSGESRKDKPEIYPANIPERCKLDTVRFNHEPWEYEEEAE